VRIAVAVATSERSRAVEATRVTEHAVVLDLLLPMEPNQREPRVLAVIEWLVAFAAFDVTIDAGLALVLARVGLLVRVTTGAVATTVSEFELGLVTTRAGVLQMLAEQPKTEFRVIDMGTLEGTA
jgi:hypothetical protein